MTHDELLEDEIWTAMNDATTCQRCLGCGKVANTDDGESWLHWLNLPPGSDLAVRMGLVAPMPCPDCGGNGKAGTQP